MLKINLFVEEKMQSKITEKLKISKSQKNNSIKLLVATIALYASLTASDEVAAILNDDALGAKAACISVKYTRDNGESSSEEMKPKKVFPVLVTTTIAKVSEDSSSEGKANITVDAVPEVNSGGDAESLPPEDKPQVEGAKPEDVVMLDDLIRTLTGKIEQEEDDYVRGTKPNERTASCEEDLEEEDDLDVNATTEIGNEQLAPTAANVIFGWGVFVVHSAGSALDYITPNFVKSFYNKGRAFCTSIGEIIRFFRTKK